MRAAIATQLVGDNHPRLRVVPQQLAQEALGCTPVTSLGHQDVERYAVLIDSSPQLTPLAVDVQKHLVEMPLVAQLCSSALQPLCVLAAELQIPARYRLVAQPHTPLEHYLLNRSKRQPEAEVDPDASG